MSNHPVADEVRRKLSRYRKLNSLLGATVSSKLLALLLKCRCVSTDYKTYYVLSTEPLVIYLGNIMKHTFEIAELLKDKQVHFIKNSYHTFETEDRLLGLVREVELFRDKYPQHTIQFICPTEQEKLLFQSHGLEPSHFINKNAFVDEHQFNVIPNIEREFDAIYNGQLAIYKRHELATKINSLALIVYRHTHIGRSPENDAYVERVKLELAHAKWMNDTEHLINPKDILNYLNRAKVGLCLSSEEGPMAASIEYMLCGLAIVSTRSLGGREVFFDPEFCRIVDDTPDAVNQGVQELVKESIDPYTVREKTIEKMKIHRNRFINVVQAIYDESGVERCYKDDWDRTFINKMRTSCSFPLALFRQINGGMDVEFSRQMADKALQ